MVGNKASTSSDKEKTQLELKWPHAGTARITTLFPPQWRSEFGGRQQQQESGWYIDRWIDDQDEENQMQANRWLIEMLTDEKVQVEKILYMGSNNTDLANRHQDEMNNCLSDVIIYPLSPLALPHGSRSYSISRYSKTHTSVDVWNRNIYKPSHHLGCWYWPV